MPSIQDNIHTLESLERPELVARWVKAYGASPFKGARHGTLVRGLAYHKQSCRFGGLSTKTSKRLLKIARIGLVTITVSHKRDKPRIRLGSQLVREWNGKSYTVHVTDKGYVMSGVTYGSLSSAAKAITGSHRSGPRFFGVAG